MSTKRSRLEVDPGNGKYYARLTVNGKRKRFTFSSNRKDSEKQLTQLLLECETTAVQSPATSVPAPVPVAAVTIPDPYNGLSLRELADKHLDWVQNNRAHTTFTGREHYLNDFLMFTGDIKVSEVTRLIIEEFYSYAKVHHSQGPNGGNQSLRNVKTMFLWAEDVEYCACPVKKFPKMYETLPETKRFSDEELKQLFACAPQDQLDFRDMILFGLLTGLRPQELRQLERRQVMRDGQGDSYIFIERHKTNRVASKPLRRSVPLTVEALEIYTRQMKKHPKSRFVFLNGNGKPYQAGSFRQRLRRWCKRAGVEPRPPYALRHTFGSLEAEANINQISLMQLMGHTQSRTTTRYVHNNYEHHRKAVAAITGRIFAAFKDIAA